MLDTQFPWLPGDVGHPEAFDAPTQRCILKGAWPKNCAVGCWLARRKGGHPIVQLVRRLEKDGARAITTS